MKQYYFIAGLPRSGTTLLSTILNQNPNFNASISGPLARFVRSIIAESSAQGGYGTECPPELRKKIIHGIFENYYADKSANVCFNTNRGWGLLFNTIKDLYPYTKIILCVRDIVWILDSFEKLYRNQPYNFSKLYNADEAINVYTRCQTLLRPDKTLGFAYNAVKQTITSEFKDDVMLIDYNELVINPKYIVGQLYDFLSLTRFEHDFNNVEAHYNEFDAEVDIPGMHSTRKVVQYLPRMSVIPPDIEASINGMEVWKHIR